MIGIYKVIALFGVLSDEAWHCGESRELETEKFFHLTLIYTFITD